MKVSGSATLAAPRARVWSALQDPTVLVQTIPGCAELRAVGGDAYEMTVSAGVASIKGTYQGSVRLAEQDPPSSYTLIASGQGAPGTVQAQARVRLTEVDSATTLLEYDADAVVGGMIGGVGQRVLAGVAKKTAGEFFAAVDSYLATGGVAAPAAVPPAVGVPAAPLGEEVPPPRAPEAVPAAPAAGAVFRPPPGARRPGPVGGDLIAATVVGGVLALLGVALGWLIGRRH